ncbi:hypothetical protein SEPCBS119000_001928 [Sporothrix epigloea]|uniref:Metallo-beta-lactamase domain-containing protein n=1 Tax=Sporothrix epigloea TaxID=1892477 RepID=A0ABP0DG08_9PEZI
MAGQLVSLPEVERLSPSCIRILGGNPGKFTLQGTNTYLVGTGRERILIDTAEGADTWVEALKRTLADEGAVLSAALITHWHLDHVGGIGRVRQLMPDVAVYQSQIARGRTGSATVAHNIAASAASRDIRNIADGDTFSVEGATLRAVHTPGHTTDHMAFVLEQEGSLFAGDNVLGQGTAVFEDLAVYLQSLARMRTLYAERDKGGRWLYPGHGPLVEDGPAKITEYIQHRQQREDQVVELLLTSDRAKTAPSAIHDGSPGSWTAMEIVEAIYADVRKDLYPAAERGIVQILEKLESEGKVAKHGQSWVRRVIHCETAQIDRLEKTVRPTGP